MKKLIPALIIVLTFSNCSRLFTGSKQNLKITSTPPGSDVYIMGHKRGVTPLTVKVYKQWPPLSIVVKEDGYKTQEVYAKKRFNPTSLLTLIPPWSVFFPFDALIYFKRNYDFTLNNGEDEYFTTKKIKLDDIEGDYLIRCTGEIIPCVIKSYTYKKTVYYDKEGNEKTAKSFEFSVVKVENKIFELGPVIWYKKKKPVKVDKAYYHKILLENGKIKAYGLPAGIVINTDENGERTITYTVGSYYTRSDVENLLSLVKVGDNFYSISDYNISNVLTPLMKKNECFSDKNNGEDISSDNLREKIKLYNSCFK